MVLRTQKNKLRISKKEYVVLRKLCSYSKNLYNEALYEVRQHFFRTGKFLRYNKLYHRLKGSENYRMLLTGCSQEVLKCVVTAMESFFAGLRSRDPAGGRKIGLPRYLRKDGFFILPHNYRAFRVDGGMLKVGFSKMFRASYNPGFRTLVIPLPKTIRHLHSTHFKQVRIVPRYGCKFFEIEFVIGVQGAKMLQNDNYLGIDLGVDNFATLVTTRGTSMILDGKYMKSVNQGYNREKARIQRLKSKQGHAALTRREVRLLSKRNCRINELLNLAVHNILQVCRGENISHVVVGDFSGIKTGIRIGKRNNQNFVGIPYHTFKQKLRTKCEMHGIGYEEVEESYTSRTCFGCGLARRGNRRTRGLYRCSECGYVANADVNGALNILRKVVPDLSLRRLGDRGRVTRPARIRLLQPPRELNSADQHVACTGLAGM